MDTEVLVAVEAYRKYVRATRTENEAKVNAKKAMLDRYINKMNEDQKRTFEEYIEGMLIP